MSKLIYKGWKVVKVHSSKLYPALTPIQDFEFVLNKWIKRVEGYGPFSIFRDRGWNSAFLDLMLKIRLRCDFYKTYPCLYTRSEDRTLWIPGIINERIPLIPFEHFSPTTDFADQIALIEEV